MATRIKAEHLIERNTPAAEMSAIYGNFRSSVQDRRCMLNAQQVHEHGLQMGYPWSIDERRTSIVELSPLKR
jgi:hypothetical protein